VSERIGAGGGGGDCLQGWPAKERKKRRQALPVESAAPPLESDLRRAGRRRAPSPFPSGVRRSIVLAPPLPPFPARCPSSVELVDVTGRNPPPSLHLLPRGSQRQHRDARRVGCDCCKPCFFRRISSLSFAHKGYLPLEMSVVDSPTRTRCPTSPPTKSPRL
jgi:hypothetical protein